MAETVLINPESGNAESFEPQQAQDLMQKGYQVPLVDQNGEAYIAPLDEARQLVSQGTHTHPNDAQLQHLLDQTHYSSPKQQALSFIEGALEPLTAGGYSALATATGLTTQKDILKREEFNPGTHTAGQVTGLGVGVGLMPETSIPGVIAKASKAAAGAIEATGGFGTVAKMLTKGAIEGGLFQAAHELNEGILGDPNSTAEHVLSNIGLSAALGGGLNLALAPTAAAVKKSIELGSKVTNTIGEYIGHQQYGVSDIFLPKKGLLKTGGKIYQAVKTYVEQNADKVPMLETLSHLSNMAIQTEKLIEKSAGGIFASGITSGLEDKNASEPTNEPLKMDKLGTLVMNHATNPEGLIEHLTNATQNISEYSPSTVDALSAQIGRAVNFLASKVPSEGKKAPFDAPRQPTNNEISTFNRYAQTIDNPIDVLKRVRDATILPQDIETLIGAYPDLYKKMRERVMGKLVDFTSKKDSQIPYKTRLGLSMFLGENLDSTMSTEGIQFSQMALQANQAQLNNKMAQQAQARPSKSGMRQMKSTNNDLTTAQQANFRHGRNSQ